MSTERPGEKKIHVVEHARRMKKRAAKYAAMWVTDEVLRYTIWEAPIFVRWTKT